jgi:lysophospholipase L1-like esterase
VDGGEVPAVGPKVAAVWIGINELSLDLQPAQSAQRYAFLLDWLRAALPGTRLLAVAVLPNADRDVAPLNAAYAAEADARGIPFVRCAQDINPTDTAVLYDGIHATPATQQVFLECLAPVVRSQLEAASAAA